MELSAYKAAYLEEHSTRLRDSSNYVYSINRLQFSNEKLLEALKLEQAMPKTIVNSNPDWWKFGLGGTVVGALIYFAVEHFLIKK